MFRQEEVFIGGWREKTIDAMQKRRFEQRVAQLPPLGAGRLSELSPAALERRLEMCWQDVPRKPMRTQQLSEVWKHVLGSIQRQADCLSQEEHELVERALILGGSARIEDAQELEAARALSLRLWASVGLVSGRPHIELETHVLEPAAKAFARSGHDEIRARLEAFSARLTGMLYCIGAMDDRRPQQALLQEVLSGCAEQEQLMQLARRYLWASFDCVDYHGGVMLVHRALAEPHHLIASARRSLRAPWKQPSGFGVLLDILPEEIPLQRDLERAVSGALRDEYRAEEVARDIRYLCKQGAPLSAMEDVLQSTLIVYLSRSMRCALENMYYRLPKWIECCDRDALQ